ncbi:sulfur oxidation c-type cytochrome SoxX [Sphaerotilus sp.]|uniref:sulfur oxidation c-type cytochrome SoxX n=1 Tax=Sphaerotilus sp. TaxID=2093942 RepID=UPI00286E2653|nr:sulfur oxidation c-type cytochrome SoxX [Sphaerotilus sp.]
MKTFKTVAFTAVALAVAAVGVGCASGPSPAELDREALQVIRSAFRDEGIVKVARLDQDAANEACSKALGKEPPAEVVKAVEAANLQSVKAPSDGKYLGDWKEGEKIAQSGRGLTWTDDAKTANGGNCYNCHQISKQEISFGTIGPSLYQYGKLRGVADPASQASKPIIDYTWNKLWNARAYNACSQMPRFGHMGILDEAQIRHVMALLLDPKSPVNQ